VHVEGADGIASGTGVFDQLAGVSPWHCLLPSGFLELIP
jgi:hypothetical protein